MIDWNQIPPSRLPAAIKQAEKGRISEAYAGNVDQFFICIKQPTVSFKGWPSTLWERSGDSYRKVSETVGSFRPDRSRFRQMLEPDPTAPDPTFIMAWGDSELRKKSTREKTMKRRAADRLIDEKLREKEMTHWGRDDALDWVSDYLDDLIGKPSSQVRRFVSKLMKADASWSTYEDGFLDAVVSVVANSSK